MARIDELFHYLKDNKGSDLHLSEGQPPKIRVHGAVSTEVRACGAAATRG